MLTARMSGWGTRWQVTSDAAPLTTVKLSGWRGEPAFTLGERDYRVACAASGSRFTLRDGDTTVAVAEGLGRKTWQLVHDEVTYSVRRVSLWRGDQEVLGPDGAAIGHIRRANAWYTELEADVPGVPDAVGVFVLAAVIASWTQLAAVTAAVSG